MSRIGKKSIVIPAGVAIRVDGANVNVRGPQGELVRRFSEAAEFKIENGKVWVSVKDGNNKTWGLCRALLNNMIKGVSAGFETVLEFSGVGYKAQAKGQELELSLGYTNPVVIKAPAGVSFQVEKNLIKVTGMDNEAVGQTAAKIRAARPPEPYKGTGIKYADETIIRKAGKKAVTGA
ncbi:MAG: 50S ribosomal protein L6 [Patescibacteria group bacterium]|mgnify:FL=1